MSRSSPDAGVFEPRSTNGSAESRAFLPSKMNFGEAPYAETDGSPVRIDNFPPFGHHHSSLCSRCGGQHIRRRRLTPSGRSAFSPSSDAGIVGQQSRPLLSKGASQLYRRGPGQIIGPGLEGQAEYSDSQAVEVAAEPVPEGKEWKLPLLIVDVR